MENDRKTVDSQSGTATQRQSLSWLHKRTGKKRRGRRALSYEWAIYGLVWIIVFFYPVVYELLDLPISGRINWRHILSSWISMTPFLLLFLLHYFFICRYFLQDKLKRYLLSLIICLALFSFTKYIMYDRNPPAKRPEMSEHMEHRQEPVMKPLPEPGRDFKDNNIGNNTGHAPAIGPERIGIGNRHGNGPHMPEPDNGLIPFPLILDIVIAVLMSGGTLAVVLVFQYENEISRRRETENSHLQQELQYLKAQLNPHFLMNMLNNIHGMVEVSPEKAQDMILELSKLMRYVLYEGAKDRTTLSKEMDFIHNYLSLMRERCSGSKVNIEAELPNHCPDNIVLPPLLSIVFIENAFKHGISYRIPSYVTIKVEIADDSLVFKCHNSNIHYNVQDENHGVGLENVRKRLDLIYGDKYKLDIEDKPDEYSVTLVIPKEQA